MRLISIPIPATADIRSHIPSLRRICLLLWGGDVRADEIIGAVLCKLVHDDPPLAENGFSRLHQIYQSLIRGFLSDTESDATVHQIEPITLTDQSVPLALSALSNRARAAIILAEVTSFSKAEIAQIMKISESELSIQLDYAYQKLIYSVRLGD